MKLPGEIFDEDLLCRLAHQVIVGFEVVDGVLQSMVDRAPLLGQVSYAELVG
ncbi:hypothetical protein AB0O20_34330 [Streptomyces kronopolitis]|uniref:hypothetical protein n=1 Tax=Streptomyces kronopolitis TaxID=1612435 RepID=UPI003422BCA4